MFAQEPEPSSVPTPSPKPETLIQIEDDPTKPIIFSIRHEYRNLKNDASSNTAIFRFDKVILKNLGNKGGAKGLILRFDIPVNAVSTPTTTKTGLGDLYAQALYVPHVRRKFAVAVGSGIVFPTATSDILGSGKLTLTPTVVPIWYLNNRKRIFLIRIQNPVSVAGKTDRADINYFVAAPLIVNHLTGRWWIMNDTEFRWDWRSKRVSGVTGLQIGRMIKHKYGFWIKPEVLWGPGRLGDFNLKFTVFRVR